MNSNKVIKFVAGAGKTTYAENYMRTHKNGLYLAFNDKVVNELRDKGFLCKTIDSLFQSFIIPKFTTFIPLIANGSKIKCKDPQSVPSYLKGFANIRIKEDGSLFNGSNKIKVNLNTPNKTLYQMENFKSSIFVKFIFSKDILNLSHQLRADLSQYIINNYSEKVIMVIKSRFEYIIIDEAQDLKEYREIFAKILYDSDIKLILLGDDLQNINGGGKWFENCIPDFVENKTHRCPENICKWIRDNLNIEIYADNDKIGKFEKIKNSNILDYDDGKRELLYVSKLGKNKEIINKWQGKKETIKKAKGITIDDDIVIIGETLNKKNMYTAITRTTKNCYSTIDKIK